MVSPAALPNVSLSDGIAPCSQMALTQISDLCPHSPLGIEITMTRHPPVQEEPRALPAVATLHTVGITAVSKVGQVFSFSLASCSVFRGWEMSGSQFLSRELIPEHKSHVMWESVHLVQFLAQFFSAIPAACHLVTITNPLRRDQRTRWGIPVCAESTALMPWCHVLGAFQRIVRSLHYQSN